jgi:hypothetical protein
MSTDITSQTNPQLINIAAPHSRLTTAIDTVSPHWRPILTVVRDAGVALCMVPHGGHRFDPPRDKPTILVMDDDALESKGPGAFHHESLRRFVQHCRHAVIVACEALPVAYAAAALAAGGLRQDVILVETRGEYEADWKATLDAINPDLAYLLCLVKPAGGVQ